ncbi:uncharacterized protein FOMMEDRAFT_168465 [Fomitiporia mediterranea MF3/22]|uniref:uncharacterized protein n=1 Tax=Fomitiporia mediterranea (strain MF3/22) TaxID=694068 RepID=UPI00044085E6|nr:uncharacterized protein FOMMEDRAFT_168465 [Fomitiporia mediterranea MF3/22]EJD01862.1 hypothetical protein FOMMEDRAFT_168465 [Fomitiporia mediterranea MF3/22]
MAVDDTFKPARIRGLLFIAGIFLVFLQAGLYTGHRQTVAPLQRTVQIKPGSTITEHPIPKLMAQAEDKFRNLLKRQSKSLSEAVAEYKRRYSRDPPKGFDEWFKFAMEKGVKIIDDYNAITEDLLPFMSLSGEELRRRVDQVSHLPSIDMVRLYNGTVKAMNMQQNRWQDEEVSGRANGFRRMIEKVGDRLPDMDFPINGKAEGRILIPWEHKQYPELSVRDTSGGIDAVIGSDFTADWRGDGNVWESWRRTCPRDSKARKLFSSIKTLVQAPRAVNFLGYINGRPAASAGENLTFAESVDDKYDFCENPSQHYQQGHFFSDWRTISVLYPVFSPAKTQGYADIRIPSHYYHQATPQYTYSWDTINLKGKATDDMEVSWDNKKDVIFWRGATTGGGNSPSGFAAQYQRHRFVRMTSSHSDENRTVVFPAPDASSYMSASVPIKKLNEELMDVAFVRLLGAENYPGGRAALHKAHRFDKAVPLGEHWRYKYLVDVDGMGYSGRFFSFLASDSAPIKATVYQEYFSDWLQPWLHYIPLSQTYEEIYNIFAFFSGPTQSMREASNSSLTDSRERYDDGQRRLRRIARAGKHWKNTIGRPVDMEGKFSFIFSFCVYRAMPFPALLGIYIYRLALEWARLWADDREAMSFKLEKNPFEAGGPAA